MAIKVADRVKETTSTTGTGTITLAGAVSGYQSFNSAFSDGDLVYYAIESGTDWETGIGTFTSSGTTLARTTVLKSSNSNNAISLSGTSMVWCDATAHLLSNPPKSIPKWQAGRYYVLPAFNSLTSNVALTANKLWGTPLTVPERCTISMLTCEVGIAVAGSNLRLGIYTDSGGQPNVLLYDSGSISSSDTGEIASVLGTPITVDAGIVWLVIVSDSAISVRCQPNNSGALLCPFFGNATYSNRGGSVNVNFIYGTLPNPFNLTLALGGGNSPIIAVTP